MVSHLPRTGRHDLRSIRSGQGFTLVELMLVILIMGIMVGLAVPSITGTMRGFAMDSAAQSVINQLSLGRQAAVSNNQVVEVRFFYLPDYNQPATSAPAAFRAVQCFIRSGVSAATYNYTPVTKTFYFPSPIVLSAVNTVSTLATTSAAGVTVLAPATPAGTDPTLGAFVRNYRYLAFHFRPDGSTDLTSTTNCISLIPQNSRVQAYSMPINYVSLQIDPLIGTVRMYRR